MSRFTSHLGLRLREDANGIPITKDGRCTWEILAPSLVYEVGEEGSGETITVGAGFYTDLASIPWPARGLLPPDGPWAKAAVIHDALYRFKGVRCGVRNGALVSYSRAQADAILDEAMKVLGVPAWKRSIIYRAVRLFGGKGWGT